MKGSFVEWWLFNIHLLLASVVVYGITVSLSVKVWDTYLSPTARVRRKESDRNAGAKSKRRTSILWQYSNVVVWLVSFLYCVSVTLLWTRNFIPHVWSCSTTVRTISPITQMNKQIIYSMFVYRIHSVYGQTEWAYNQQNLTVFVAVINALGLMVVAVNASSLTSGQTVNITPTKSRCKAHYPMWGLLISLTIDIVSSVKSEKYTHSLFAVLTNAFTLSISVYSHRWHVYICLLNH